MLNIFANAMNVASRTDSFEPTHETELHWHEARKREELRRQKDLSWFFMPKT